jgi:hypothetical protein
MMNRSTHCLSVTLQSSLVRDGAGQIRDRPACFVLMNDYPHVAHTIGPPRPEPPGNANPVHSRLADGRQIELLHSACSSLFDRPLR